MPRLAILFQWLPNLRPGEADGFTSFLVYRGKRYYRAGRYRIRNRDGVRSDEYEADDVSRD